MIISFDPGLTTGYAMTMRETYQFGHLSESLKGIYDFLSFRNPTFIVYEDFKHRPQIINTELYSLQVIGVLRLWAQQHDVPTSTMLPATAKSFWTDDKIKALGLWKPGQKHAMDALRVLLTYRGNTEPKWHDDMLRKLRDKL